MPVIFSRVKYEAPPPIILNGVPLDYGNIVKYLGVYIDSKLLWKEHIKIKLKKAKKLLMNIVRVCHPRYHSENLKLRFRTLCPVETVKNNG